MSLTQSLIAGILVVAIGAGKYCLAVESFMIIVTAQRGGDIKAGRDVLSRVPRGERLWAFKTQGDWYQVKVPGRETKGWIHISQTEPFRISASNNQRLNDAIRLYEEADRLFEEGKYREAIPSARRVAAIYRELVGEKHPDTALALDTLGKLFWGMGDFERAQPHLEQALAIRKEVLGGKHPDYAISLNNLGFLYRAIGDFSKAEQLYRQASQIWKEALGEKHPDYALSLNNLGFSYKAIGDYAKAEPLYRQALEIRKEVLGEKHPHCALSLNELGMLYSDMGHYAKAEPLYRQALAIGKDALGEKHPFYALSLNNLAVLYAFLGRWQDVPVLLDDARRVTRRHIARVLPGLSAAEQLRFLSEKVEGDFHLALSLVLTHGQDNQIVSIGTSWLLNGKAVAQEAVSERIRLSRDSRDPRLAQTVRQLQSVRDRLARITLKRPVPDRQQQHQSELTELTLREQQLSKELGQAQGEIVREDPWVEQHEVRQALEPDSLLIDIARFKVFNFQANRREEKWQTPRYAAWIIPPAGQGEIKLVDLGEAEAIEAAVQAVRTTINDAPSKLPAQGEPESEKELQQPLQQLAQMVFEPLLPHIGDAERLILSPDASLWLVPWAALPLDDGRYAIEKYGIRYVVSGRDLVTRADYASVETSHPLILADPNFDGDPSRGDAATLTRLDQHFRLRRSGSLDSLPTVQRLPETAAEARAITQSLQRYSQASPQVHTGNEALEAVFKAVRRPTVVALATHGFFLQDQQVKTSEDQLMQEETRVAALTVGGKAVENPLLRCGLLLAGCNNRDQASEETDDGVLTALEIVGTDLRGTKLVVLSACETGLGTVQNGEGVAGLRQAFQLAGAESVVASLWNVPDADTARLMVDFFNALAEGQDKVDALREAQLRRIASHRKRYGAAHPFFWAAFTLTGNR